MEQTKIIHFNLKASHRLRAKFEREFPMATYYGRMNLGSNRHSFTLPLEIYEANKEKLKAYGNKARE